MMRILSVAALMIGVATAQTTGTLSSTGYEGAGCVTRTTECGADDVNLPDPDTCGDSCDCAADDVTVKPADAVQWTSGECITCSEADGTTECNWPFLDTSDDEIYPAMVAQGVDPAYAKITCANGVATVEHFSDAGCTAANKVNNADISTAYQAAMLGMLQGNPVAACINIEVDIMSGVNIQGSHCDEIMSMTANEECLTTVLTEMGVTGEAAAAQAADMATQMARTMSIQLDVTGCEAPVLAPAPDAASGGERVATLAFVFAAAACLVVGF